MSSGHRIRADLLRSGNRTITKDPGASGTIRLRGSKAYCPLVSAAAESRTLPRPQAVGQELTLEFKTDGGDITLTVTGGFNEDGDTTFTFSDAGQFVKFEGCFDGTNFFWRKFADYSTANLTPTEAALLDGAVAGTPVVSKVLALNANLGTAAFREEGVNLQHQAAPSAKTTSATLTIAEMLTRIVTANQGAAGAATYTTDTGAAIETGLIAAYPNLQNDDCFDFTIINISTVAAEDVTVAAGATGVTLVGLMKVDSNDADGSPSTGVFRVRRTAQNVYSIYRVG
jgi:hypothetical protein